MCGGVGGSQETRAGNAAETGCSLGLPKPTESLNEDGTALVISTSRGSEGTRFRIAVTALSKLLKPEFAGAAGGISARIGTAAPPLSRDPNGGITA